MVFFKTGGGFLFLRAELHGWRTRAGSRRRRGGKGRDGNDAGKDVFLPKLHGGFGRNERAPFESESSNRGGFKRRFQTTRVFAGGGAGHASTRRRHVTGRVRREPGRRRFRRFQKVGRGRSDRPSRVVRRLRRIRTDARAETGRVRRIISPGAAGAGVDVDPAGPARVQGTHGRASPRASFGESDVRGRGRRVRERKSRSKIIGRRDQGVK